MGRNVTAVVSPNALRHNLQQIKRIAPQSKIIAMVKANAYGHGLVKVAKTVQNADALGVASIEEALKIREAGVQTDIILMEGIFRPEELSLVQNYRLTLVAHHWQQIHALQNYAQPIPEKFRIWLKINTGMNRLGFPEREFSDAWTALNQDPKVHLIGFMTHFSQADEKNNELTQQQYEVFKRLVGDRAGEKSLANSAGILAWPQTHADWVRPGLMLYGASPFPHSTGRKFNLLPAMTLRSEIIAIRTLEPGDRVGYSGTWASERKSKIGIVAMGYGDGYPWHAQNGTPVLVNGQRAPLTGRVSMDMLAVDMTHLASEVKVGDPVILWGDDLPIEEVARHANTIPYELLCRFTERVSVHFQE